MLINNVDINNVDANVCKPMLMTYITIMLIIMLMLMFNVLSETRAEGTQEELQSV